MTLTALHAERGRLDATLSDLGCGWDWSEIYKTRPRAKLVCRECGHALHAKLSPKRLRYFAHDPGSPTCSLAEESLAHHLLKAELMAAVRAAGWCAGLEASGQGWRADVLATEPTTGRRIAFEAQLSGITPDEVCERTQRMGAEGVDVCWVTDRRRPWLGQVVSLRVESPADGKRSSLAVVGGLLYFVPQWCTDLSQPLICVPGPCIGHGRWESAGPIGLVEAVRSVCDGTVHPHRNHRWEGRYQDDVRWEYAFTTPADANAAQEEVAAEKRRDLRQERALDSALQEPAEGKEAHRQAVSEVWIARQRSLAKQAVDWVSRETGTMEVLIADSGSPQWAMGIPIFFQDRPYAVLCPVAGRVRALRHKFRSLVLLAANEAHRQLLAEQVELTQRIEVVTEELPGPQDGRQGALLPGWHLG